MLAAWKRAAPGPRSLGKPLEAAIALLNPETSRELATLLGGEIGVRSEEGQGSTFTLFVPARSTGPEPAGRLGSAENGAGADRAGRRPDALDGCVEVQGPMRSLEVVVVHELRQGCREFFRTVIVL